MKIAHVGKHGCGGNDDEGAISHALRELGHEVIDVDELSPDKGPKCDLVIFHHSMLTQNFGDIPRVFWWFDLISCDDSTLRERCRHRILWMQTMTPLVGLGFMSDGDWVQNDTTGKLVHLFQGADSRFASVYDRARSPKILFTGISKRGGRKRVSWVNEMVQTYGDRFRHKRNVYQEALKMNISKYRITAAPDFPATDLYWSNRVFVSTGFGAFMVHPYCAKLATFYKEDEEIVFYRSREEMHEKIRHYLDHPQKCEEIRRCGFERTMAEHTYTHRCDELLKVVKERLL